MPISLACCITTTAPIWLAILAHFYLGETISKFDIFAIFASFTGVLIINNPNNQETSQNHVDSGKMMYSPQDIFKGSCFALASAFGIAMANICKRIMRKNIHYSVSPFWFASGCTLLSPMAHYSQAGSHSESEVESTITATYDFKILSLLFIATIATFFGQILQSKAF